LIDIDVATSPTTKMPVSNLAIVITLTLLHHPHDPRIDAILSNPHKQGGAAILVIHLITHHSKIFPEKDLPPPPMPPRPTSSPPTLAVRHSPTRFLSEKSIKKKDSTIRMVSSSSTESTGSSETLISTESLMSLPVTSISTPLPSEEFSTTAEFGGAEAVRGKGRVPVLGSGVVEELRRVYEERCRIVRSQEPGKKEAVMKNGKSGGIGIGIGRVS
jgi:hypothetical protein